MWLGWRGVYLVEQGVIAEAVPHVLEVLVMQVQGLPHKQLLLGPNNVLLVRLHTQPSAMKPVTRTTDTVLGAVYTRMDCPINLRFKMIQLRSDVESVQNGALQNSSLATSSCSQL